MLRHVEHITTLFYIRSLEHKTNPGNREVIKSKMPSLRASRVHVKHIFSNTELIHPSTSASPERCRSEGKQMSIDSLHYKYVWASTQEQVESLRRHISAQAALHAAQERTRIQNIVKKLQLKHREEDLAEKAVHQRRKSLVRSQIIMAHSKSLPSSDRHVITRTIHSTDESTIPPHTKNSISLQMKLIQATLQLDYHFFCERRRTKKDQALEVLQLKKEEEINGRRMTPWLGEPDKHSKTGILSRFKSAPGRGLPGMEACPRGIEPVISVKNRRFPLHP